MTTLTVAAHRIDNVQGLNKYRIIGLLRLDNIVF